MNGITPSPASRRPRRWLRRLAFALTLLAVVLVAGALFYLSDEPPPNDADLQLHEPNIPDNENGLLQIRKLFETRLDIISDLEDGFPADHGLPNNDLLTKIEHGYVRNDVFVDAFLAQAQPAFAQLDAILALPHFDDAVAFITERAWPVAIPSRAVSERLRLEIIRSLQKSDYTIATYDTARLLLLASRLAEGNSYGFQNSPIWEIYNDSATCGRDLLNESDLTVSQQTTLARAFAANEPPLSSIQHSLTFDYQLDLPFLQHSFSTIKSLLYRGLSSRASLTPTPRVRLLAHWLDFTLKPNTTRRLLADYYRGLRVALNGPYSRIDFPTLQALRPGFGVPQTYSDPRFSWLVASNAGGRYLLNGLLLDSPSALLRIPYQAIAADRLLRLGFALRGFYNDHSTLPPTLADLVPQYLPALPADPFDDQPFHYDPTRGLVYSVGTSLKDRHGSRYLTAPSPNPDYPIDPLLDAAQPTLALTFQNKTSPTAPPSTAPSASPPTAAQQMSN